MLSYIESGKSEGAQLEAGGEAFKNANGKGFFVKPTIFSGVKDDMKIYREEVFGPFAVVGSFKTEEEAIERANDTTYGLGAALFTENIAKAHRVARLIESGMVWINSSNDSDTRIPFGGVKQSGIGRELGEAGLDAYTNHKVSSHARCRGREKTLTGYGRRCMSTWARNCKDGESVVCMYCTMYVAGVPCPRIMLSQQVCTYHSIIQYSIQVSHITITVRTSNTR